jgi:hypothetical protein
MTIVFCSGSRSQISPSAFSERLTVSDHVERKTAVIQV